ncbi:ABC transporter permease (plasmid) [Arthrobacter sp. KN11-1C]|uniref:ABC transporter permease n=1 Tax=Arthrobacter sp. KN11-1C TaxID=3445774 RepID=UPI003FA06C10
MSVLTKPTPDTRVKSRWGSLPLLIPAMLVILALAVVPLLLVLRNSFAIGDAYGGISGGFTLANYAALMDPVYLKVLGYSVLLAVVNTCFCLVAGYVVSYYVVTRPPGRQALVLLLLVVPFFTDFMVRTFAWITLLSSDGPILKLLAVLGLSSPGTSWVPSTGAVLMGLLYAFLPTAVFPIFAVMRSIDPSLKQAAQDLGCTGWGVHRRIIIPLTAPGLVSASMLTFVPTLGVFVIPVLLGGGKEQLVGNVIVTLYTEFRDQAVGSAASIVMLALMAVSVLIAVLLGRLRKVS